MRHLFTRTLPLFAVFALLAPSACSSVRVRSDYDPQINFQGYRTYRWAERQRPGDPAIDNDIVAKRVRRAVNQALQAKGYTEVTEGPADFLVGWHGAVRKKFSVETIGSDYVYGPGWYMSGWGGTGLYPARTYTREWKEGTLIIDIADAERNELVWRGSAMEALSHDPPKGEKAQEKMNGVVEKILDEFPPKG